VRIRAAKLTISVKSSSWKQHLAMSSCAKIAAASLPPGHELHGGWVQLLLQMVGL
jgi:hypothetical protein